MIADWYFDFVSPFSYLQCERPAARTRASIRPRRCCSPRSSTRTARRARRKSPRSARSPTASSSGRRRRWASRSSFRTSIRSIRSRFCASRSPAIAGSMRCTRIFRFVWRDGRLPDLPIEWAELAHELGVPMPRRASTTPEVKDALRRETDEAIARGVFGVPTIAVGNELFWGADATEMALDYMRAGVPLRRSRISARRRIARGRRSRRGEAVQARLTDWKLARKDRPRSDQRVDRGVCIARFAKHVARVLAVCRRIARHRECRRRELERRRDIAASRPPRDAPSARAMNCAVAQAPRRSVSTGVTQQSTRRETRAQSASVALPKMPLECSPRRVAPASPCANWPARDPVVRALRTARSRTSSSSAPTASQRPSRVG